MDSDSTLVRKALRSDAPLLAAVREAAAPDQHTDLQNLEALLATSEGLVYVAQSQGSVVGFFVLQLQAHPAVPARNPIQLWQLYVLPSFHGTGVAAQLMDAVLGHARSQEHDVVWLGVSEHNERGMAFYRKRGFKAVGSHTVGSGEHSHHDVVMSYLLR
jgi:diamine N-acetyltransferase